MGRHFTARVHVAVLATSILLGCHSVAYSQESRDVFVSGFGARSGVLRSFGINSEAALRAAAEEINSNGGVKLGDGAKGRIVWDYLDTRCNAEEAISVPRRIATTPSIVAIGPTYSVEAEPLVGNRPQAVRGAVDTALQRP